MPVIIAVFASQPACLAESIIEIPTDNLVKKTNLSGLNGWHIIVPVIMANGIDSKTAMPGDLIEARLSDEIRFGRHLIAGRDSLVRGHVVNVGAPRRKIATVFSNERHMKSRGFLAIEFDQIVSNDGETISIKGIPCKQKNVWLDTGNSAQEIDVDDQGRIVRAEAVLTGNMKTASRSALVATNLPVPGNFVFGMMTGPLIMGAVGAASPSLGANKPCEDNSRLKGMTQGVINGLPVVPFVLKGNEVVISPADQLMVDVCIKANLEM